MDETLMENAYITPPTQTEEATPESSTPSGETEVYDGKVVPSVDKRGVVTQ